MRSLPSAWVKVTLADVAIVQTGLSKSANRQGESVSLPYLRVANVQDGYLDLGEVKYIDVPAGQLERFRLHPGDVLLTEGGDFDKLGRGCVWNGEIEDCVHQNHVFAVRVSDENRLVSAFFALVIQSERARAYFISCAKQTTNLASINSSQIKQLPMKLPPIAEQLEIVRIVNEFNLGIHLAENLLSALEQRKQGLMQQLLTGRRRLKGFKGKWKEVTLGSVLERVTRKNSDSCKNALTVSAQRGLISQDTYFAKQIASEANEHYVLLNRGEFAYNRSASNGYPFGAIKRLEAHEEGIVSTLCLCFGVADLGVLDSDFLVWLIEAGQLNRAICKIAHEGARSHGLLNVTAKDFFDIKTTVPGFPEQRAIAAIMNDTQTEIDALRGQVKALKVQKRALMQKLLSGNWRMPKTALLKEFSA